jgi:NAD(P)-dependent dehydrogenase (short-subunit alcohol dehydrogenase family)
MARIFVTGSTTGLGLLAGKHLLEQGHDVIFHARNRERAGHLRNEIGGRPIVTGNLANSTETNEIADQVNAIGAVDGVIHNAGAGYGGPERRALENLPEIFAVNVLAPYILTARISGPQRLIYISSSMHRTKPYFQDIAWRERIWSGSQAYSESKFYVTALAFAVARLRPQVHANAVDPGWVPTRMGGQSAPDDLEAGAATQVALATGDEASVAALTGQYLHHMAVRAPDPRTRDIQVQERLLALCREFSGVAL